MEINNFVRKVTPTPHTEETPTPHTEETPTPHTGETPTPHTEETPRLLLTLEKHLLLTLEKHLYTPDTGETPKHKQLSPNNIITSPTLFSDVMKTPNIVRKTTRKSINTKAVFLDPRSENMKK